MIRANKRRRRKLRLRIAGCGTRYSGDIPTDRPLKRNIEGTPIPEEGSADEISRKLMLYWPVWDLQDHLEKEGIIINRAIFRPGWVKLHVDWSEAERRWCEAKRHWHQNLTAEIILDIIAMAANEQELYFNHWQVIWPQHLDINSWTDTLNKDAREAVIFFRTDKVHGKSIGDLLQYCKLEEVNSIILANAFSLMDKGGKHDQD